MVTSKRHKMDKNAPILRCTFLHQYLDFLNDNPTTSISPSKCLWGVHIFHMLNISWVTCNTVSVILFGFGFNPQKYLSLDRDLTFQIFIGIHPGNTGLKLVYYYSYNEKALFIMGVCSNYFNKNYIILVRI